MEKYEEEEAKEILRKELGISMEYDREKVILKSRSAYRLLKIIKMIIEDDEFDFEYKKGTIIIDKNNVEELYSSILVYVV